MPQWGRDAVSSTRPQLTKVLRTFDHMSGRASSAVIASYSSSFSLATRFLAPRVRADIAHLYAMVRIADELVDGSASAAGMTTEEITTALNDYEQQVLRAPHQRFHLDPVLHAYGITARRCGFSAAHIQAFFASMRKDLTKTTYDQQGFSEYVYGSAEVIGLLCLDIFYCHRPVPSTDRALLETGAQALGAAFQKINFLRDLAEDSTVLGRHYFPITAEFSEADKNHLIADIHADLQTAESAIKLLPPRCLLAVSIATALFRELTIKLAATPVRQLLRRRVRIPTWRKLLISFRALTWALHIIITRGNAQ